MSNYNKGAVLSNNAIAVWFVASLFTCFQFCTQVITGPMTSSLMAEFNLNAVTVSYAVSSFFYIYLIMQLPAGIILDRFPNRYVMSITCLICSVGCLFMGLANNIYLFIIARMLCGLGSAFGFIGTMRILRNYFPIKYIALFIGLTEMMGFLVTALCENLASYFLPLIGFQKIFLYMGTIGTLIALSVFIVMHKKFVPKFELAPPAKQLNLLKDLSELIFDGQLWILGFIAFSFFSLVTAFAALWGVPALVNIHKLSLHTSTQAISCIFLGIAVGGPLMGYLSTKMTNHRILIFSCGVTGAILLLMLISVADMNFWNLAIILFLCGMLCCCYLLSFAIAGDITPPRLSGLTMGFINMVTMTSALLMQPIMGYLVSLNGVLEIVDGTPIYELAGYKRACLSIVVLYILASISSWRLNTKARAGHS